MIGLNTLTDADFDEKIKGAGVPVLVLFGAAWCGPCKMCAPHLRKLEREYQQRMMFFAIDVDANPETKAKYGIKNIPTTMVLSHGDTADVMASQIGAVPKAKFQALIDSALR